VVFQGRVAVVTVARVAKHPQNVTLAWALGAIRVQAHARQLAAPVEERCQSRSCVVGRPAGLCSQIGNRLESSYRYRRAFAMARGGASNFQPGIVSIDAERDILGE
jgi:hypothetical protein